MKKFLVAFCFLFLISACDDGDIEIASFDFLNSTVKVCQAGTNNFFLYTYKDKRALILKIPETAFENKLDPSIKLLTINATNEAIYREYVGNVADDNICAFPTNVSLGLEKQWSGVGGTIKIETSISKTEDLLTGVSRYATYNHRITLINPSFSNGAGGEQKMDLIEFGTYSKPNENNLNNFVVIPNEIKKCTANTFFYKTNARQALELTVDSTIFSTSILDTPKVRFINGTTNKFLFKVFNANVPDTYFCTTTVPVTPNVVELWTGQNGTNTTGIIEVITSSIPATSPQQFKHQIRLKKVSVEKSGLSFNFGNDYDLGFFIQ